LLSPPVLFMEQERWVILGFMFDCFIFPERTFAMLWKKTVWVTDMKQYVWMTIHTCSNTCGELYSRLQVKRHKYL
jgi:hypothetical protein